MSHRSALSRLLAPTTLAVVGANEALGMSNNAIRPMLEAGRTVHLVNPTRQELYGLPALPSLSAVGAPVDAVLSLVNAERSVGVMEEAASLGCGGVVVAAAGFAEMGDVGLSLQRRLAVENVPVGIDEVNRASRLEHREDRVVGHAELLVGAHHGHVRR